MPNECLFLALPPRIVDGCVGPSAVRLLFGVNWPEVAWLGRRVGSGKAAVDGQPNHTPMKLAAVFAVHAADRCPPSCARPADFLVARLGLEPALD